MADIARQVLDQIDAENAKAPRLSFEFGPLVDLVWPKTRDMLTSGSSIEEVCLHLDNLGLFASNMAWRLSAHKFALLQKEEEEDFPPATTSP